MTRQPFGRVTILVVNTVPVAVEHEADGMVFFGIGGPAPWLGTLKDGMCVRLRK